MGARIDVVVVVVVVIVVGTLKVKRGTLPVNDTAVLVDHSIDQLGGDIRVQAICVDWFTVETPFCKLADVVWRILTWVA
jgi:hypothetical protein